MCRQEHLAAGVLSLYRVALGIPSARQAGDKRLGLPGVLLVRLLWTQLSRGFLNLSHPLYLFSTSRCQMPNTARVGQPLRITCTFKNTLTIPLTNIRFSVESLGISSVKNINQA